MNRQRLLSLLFLFALFLATATSAWAASPFAPQAIPPGVAPATERVEDYEAALARGKATGKDIVVFQRGSDWNVCAETLYQTIWSTDAFAKALGDGFILLAVDDPESPGGRPIICDGKGALVMPDAAGGPLPRLQNQCGEKSTPPPSEITAVVSEAKVKFTKRADGAFLAARTPNPPQDMLLLRLAAARGGKILRLDFPLDDSLPNGGPGRAGNAVLSEVEVAVEARPLPCQAAWGSVNSGNNFGPWTAVDGVTDKPDEGWNLNGGQHVPRTLLVLLKEPAPAGAAVAVRLVFKSQWGQHVAGCVRAAILGNKQTEDDILAVASAELTQLPQPPLHVVRRRALPADRPLGRPGASNRRRE